MLSTSKNTEYVRRYREKQRRMKQASASNSHYFYDNCVTDFEFETSESEEDNPSSNVKASFSYTESTKKTSQSKSSSSFSEKRKVDQAFSESTEKVVESIQVGFEFTEAEMNSINEKELDLSLERLKALGDALIDSLNKNSSNNKRIAKRAKGTSKQVIRSYIISNWKTFQRTVLPNLKRKNEQLDEPPKKLQKKESDATQDNQKLIKRESVDVVNAFTIGKNRGIEVLQAQQNGSGSVSKLQEEILELKQTIKDLKKQNDDFQRETSTLKLALKKAEDDSEPELKELALNVIEIFRENTANQKKVKSSKTSFNLFWNVEQKDGKEKRVKKTVPVTLLEQKQLLSRKKSSIEVFLRLLDEHFEIIPKDRYFKLPNDHYKSRENRQALPTALYKKIQQEVCSQLQINKCDANMITKYLDAKYDQRDESNEEEAEAEEETIKDESQGCYSE